MVHQNDNAPLTPEDLWSELARESQKGNKKSYNRLLSEISVYIKNYLITRVAQPEWAEDITQEALLSVHKSLHTYGTDRPFKPWLMAIVNFRKTDYLRKHYATRGDKQTSLDNTDFLSTHVTNPIAIGELKDIEAALQDLPEKQRIVFELVKIKGYTAKEAAKELDMSVSAVKVSAHRTANKLKKALEDEG